MSEPTDWTQYPSIDLAYDRALASFGEAQRRVELMEDRLEKLIALASTVTLGAASFLAALHVSFQATPMICAALLFLVGIAVAFYARVSGGLILTSPLVLWRSWLHLETVRFKADLVYTAGQSFESNRLEVLRKSRLAAIASTAFLLEGLLALWGLAHP